jgi:hypothetical protein
MRRTAAVLGVVFFSATPSVFAADLAVRNAAPVSGPVCWDVSRPAASRPDLTFAVLQQTAQDHYSVSLEVSGSQSTIYSARPRFEWATEARIYCGMAVGYLASGEINDEAIGKCNCFYAQMRQYMRN